MTSVFYLFCNNPQIIIKSCIKTARFPFAREWRPFFTYFATIPQGKKDPSKCKIVDAPNHNIFVDLILEAESLKFEAKSLELLINESNKLDDVNKETFRSSFKNLFDQFEFIMERIKFDTDPTSIYSNAKEMYKIIKENFEERTNGIPCKN